MNNTSDDLILRIALTEDLSPSSWKAIEKAVREELGKETFLDVTSDAIFSGERGEASVVAKSEGILSGTVPFKKVYGLVDEEVAVSFLADDGDVFRRGDRIASVRGRIGSILRGERTALNFLGHLSGIATEVRKLARLLEGSGIAILDTRKTLPGLRELEKRAVIHGGGRNHRMGLYDMVLVKDNHVDAAGSITEAMRRVRARHGSTYKIEVETRTVREVEEALACGADRIMLDNMSGRMIREAARLARGKAEIEVSGNMNPRRIKKIRRITRTYKVPVDYISVGYITHSAGQSDFSLQISFTEGR